MAYPQVPVLVDMPYPEPALLDMAYPQVPELVDMPYPQVPVLVYMPYPEPALLDIAYPQVPEVVDKAHPEVTVLVNMPYPEPAPLFELLGTKCGKSEFEQRCGSGYGISRSARFLERIVCFTCYFTYHVYPQGLHN
jgi:hypothetical protein